MELLKAEFIPTLNEYVERHINDESPHIKSIIDDFSEFPECDDFQENAENVVSNLRLQLLVSFNKRIDDIIILNRYAMHQYNYNVENISSKFKEYDEQHGGMFSKIYEQHDDIAIEKARTAFKNFDWTCEVLMARKIADEGFIIHLWATVEQYVNRALLIMGMENKNTSFQWNKLKELSKDNGIDLETIPSYDIVNEVRVVNNKIKHLYVVDNELAKFTAFSELNGVKMNYIDYRTHEYALGVYHFMNRFIMAMGPVISYAPDRNL